MAMCPSCDRDTLEFEHTEDDIIIKCSNCGYNPK